MSRVRRPSQVKVLEGEGRQQKEELQEVHGRLSQEEQKEEEARREAFTLKQRVVECEAGREAALKEVSLRRWATLDRLWWALQALPWYSLPG